MVQRILEKLDMEAYVIDSWGFLRYWNEKAYDRICKYPKPVGNIRTILDDNDIERFNSACESCIKRNKT